MNHAAKRAVDVTLCGAAALLMLIPALAVATLVRLTSPGPVLYWSTRVGRDNQTFRMPKFRSMRVGAPQVATHLLSNPVTHLTPIGGWLRRTSLDEIPQLWSILRGNMSIVGPRPHAVAHNELYRTLIKGYMVRHKVRPGRKSTDGTNWQSRIRWRWTWNTPVAHQRGLTCKSFCVPFS